MQHDVDLLVFDILVLQHDVHELCVDVIVRVISPRSITGSRGRSSPGEHLPLAEAAAILRRMLTSPGDSTWSVVTIGT